MANNTTTWRLDMSSAPGVWTTGPAFAQGRADFGVWPTTREPTSCMRWVATYRGGGFFDSTNAVDELSVGAGLQELDALHHLT